MNESIPSSVHPAHAAQKPRIWFGVKRDFEEAGKASILSRSSMCDRPPGLFEWAFGPRNPMKNHVGQTVCAPFFVGQVVNLRPIGNRPAPGAASGTREFGNGFQPCLACAAAVDSLTSAKHLNSGQGSRTAFGGLDRLGSLSHWTTLR